MDSEDKLVERITRALSARGRLGRKTREAGGVLKKGFGDDAAVISPVGRDDRVLSCDAFLEGVHFLVETHPPDSVGYKALARATSDLAAMGAKPRFFLLTLVLPASRTGAWLDAFLIGMNRAANELKIEPIGGDTTKWPSVMASITVLGEVAHGRAVMRSGARPGDTIYVSGTLGRAELGLELVRKGFARRKELSAWLQPHLYPHIPLELGFWLARNRVASSMMDLSDGLSTDLPRLCAASGVGARLRSDNIPRVDMADLPRRRLGAVNLNPLAMALHGGEDYQLLFTVSPRHLKHLQKAPGFPTLTAIGEITAGRSLLLVEHNGSSRPLKSRGWDPFRKKS